MPDSVRPRDGSPPDSPVPGILQARTLEWVAISFSRGSPNPGIEPTTLESLERRVLLTAELPGKPTHIHILVSISPRICRKAFLYLRLLQKLEKGLAIHS